MCHQQIISNLKPYFLTLEKSEFLRMKMPSRTGPNVDPIATPLFY